MATIRLGAAAVIREFTKVATFDTSRFNRESLEDELGRFRVWAGNLGALQKGHSSLDYRLRDAPLLSSNALKLLDELRNNLLEANAVLCGARLPYEQQLEATKPETEEDDDFFSEDEDDDSDSDAPKTELGQRWAEVVDIIDNLYKLSVRIRQPTLRARSLKAATYRPKDPETGADILDQYATFDVQHTRELVRHLRSEHTDSAQDKDDPIIERLAKAITLRRRQFKYWRRHRDKLGVATILEEEPVVPTMIQRPEGPQRFDTLEVQVSNPPLMNVAHAASEKSGKTLLSGTEATRNPHQQSLDDIVDSKSVTSYAPTVRDLHGRDIELPRPPSMAEGGEKDFECPYCFIICPARYGKGRSWRTHLLQDLQPYICTYPECGSSEQLFRSRREWSDHEATHRKAWRCPEHPHAVYPTMGKLRDHLSLEHRDNISEHQLDSIVKVGETSTVDLRDLCPICLVPTGMEGGLQNHIANHLERLASFSLPKSAEDDDSEGASGKASHGGSTTTESSNSTTSSPISQPRFDTDRHELPEYELSAELLSNLPDSTERRVENFLSNEAEASGSDEEDSVEISAELDEHMAETEAFRTYLTGLPGSQSVRFMRRFGRWQGTVIFDSEDFAVDAMKSFDHTRFPDVKIQQKAENQATLKFSLLAKRQPEGQHGIIRSTSGTPIQQSVPDKEGSLSSMSLRYSTDEDIAGDTATGRLRILPASEVPTLHSLYRSRQLRQRDQSYAPSDTYNGIISFCYHDITRLAVDCIVNSANRGLKITRTPDSLNQLVHRAAGPGLKRECEAHGTIKAGAVALTSAYNLPCEYVLHAARPQYSGSTKSTGKFNILTQCYRSALKMASVHNIRTIAFPCIGAGGCGFPSRAAARIALQEVREWLDVHKATHTFEKIVFCVFSAADQKAYTEFLPVFFPPTHGDLENISSESPRQQITFSTLHGVPQQVDEIAGNLVPFSENVSDFPRSVLSELTRIAASFRRIVSNLNGSNLDIAGQTVEDVNLICAILQSISGDVVELVEQTRDSASSGQRTHETVWKAYNANLQEVQGLDLQNLLALCNDFVQILDDVVVLNGTEPTETTNIRLRLGNYRLKQTGEDHKQVRDNFEEILYEREFQKGAGPGSGGTRKNDTIKPYQIPSLARLYQLGQLQDTSTFAKPNHRDLSTVALIREDITRLDVDAIVNSTDPTFRGMGTLDRLIFQKGGDALREECESFRPCKEGDIKVSQGGQLPARHIIHVVMFETYRTGTKEYLRKMYREILYLANSLKATSLAIPAIGTGVLNYPRRDCAALAMEEVKRFLESFGSSTTLEKIIFCVYGSNDEYIYKANLPIYFPRVNGNLHETSPLGPEERNIRSLAQAPNTVLVPGVGAETPKRTLFGSIGEAFRSVRFGKQPAIVSSRSIQREEASALRAFEKHVMSCPTCGDILRLYNEGRNLCPDGYAAAQKVLKLMYMVHNHTVYSTILEGGNRVAVDLPPDFPNARTLLVMVEQSYRDDTRSRPFVSPNQPYETLEEGAENKTPPPGVTIYNTEDTIPRRTEPEKANAFVFSWDQQTQKTTSLHPHECSIHIFQGKVELYESDWRMRNQIPLLSPLLSLELTPSVPLIKSGSSDVALKARVLPESRIQTESEFILRSRSPMDCETLFQRLKSARRTVTNRAEEEVAQSQERPPLQQSDEDRKSLQLVSSNKEMSALTSPSQTVLALLRSLPEDSQGMGMTDLAMRLGDNFEALEHAVDQLVDRGFVYTSAENERFLPIERLARNIDRAQGGRGDGKLYIASLDQGSSKLDNDKPDMSGPLPINIDEYFTYLDLASTGTRPALPGSQPIQEPRPLTRAATIDFVERTDKLPLDKALSLRPSVEDEEEDIDTANPEARGTVDQYPILLETEPRPSEPRSKASAEIFDTSQSGEGDPPAFIERKASRYTYKPNTDVLSSLGQILADENSKQDQEPGYPSILPHAYPPDPEPSSAAVINHPRPTTPDTSQAAPIPPGARWTKIDRRLVNAQALEEANERFEQQEAHNIVLRVLSREEIVKLAERTRAIRDAKEELQRFAREVGEGHIRNAKETLQRSAREVGQGQKE